MSTADDNILSPAEIRRQIGLAHSKGDMARVARFNLLLKHLEDDAKFKAWGADAAEEDRKAAAAEAAEKARLENIAASKASAAPLQELAQKFVEGQQMMVEAFHGIQKQGQDAFRFLRAAGIDAGHEDGMRFALEVALNNDLLGLKLPLRKIGYDVDRKSLPDVVAGLCRGIGDAIAQDEQRRTVKVAAE